jgi:glucosaminylphosphatidylinositol acyltransferase
MIITCMAILAVDFRAFPRRFAKAENWGTSLMDMGVGSFVFSAGVVSARSVLKDNSSSPLSRRLTTALRHSIPLFVLGLIRLYSVKGLDYAEHVTEYGVHWNFFFTLGLLPPFVELAHTVTTTVCPSYEVLSVLIAGTYQIVLESTDLKAYILVSPRGDSILSKNREGVFSFIGYLAIFLAGRGTGQKIIPRSKEPGESPGKSRKRLLVQMAGLTAIWSLIFCVVSEHIFGVGQSIPVSRRLANLPYVLWVTAFNIAHLFLFCLLETLFFPHVHKAADPDTEERQSHRATSQIMRAINKNGLAVFLVANLMTGLVNLTVKTLDAGTYEAMGILSVYAASVTGVALTFDKMGWRLKL